MKINKIMVKIIYKNLKFLVWQIKGKKNSICQKFLTI